MNRPIKANILKVYGRDPATLDELAECVTAVINSQLADPVVGFAWDLVYSDLVSNSHSSPEGLVENWLGKPHLPTGYPGFTGRVWIRYGGTPKSWGSDPFRLTLTHPGTGGAGSYSGPWAGVSASRFHRYGHRQVQDAYPEIHCYSWDYRFYLEDWPGIAAWVEKQQMMSLLSGRPWQTSHRFSWNDNQTAAADAAFMAECVTIKARELA
jgi:hypothetical protein